MDLKDLFSTNYDLLWKKIQSLLGDWSNKNLSWLERLELVKSTIFPPFLFLFQALPIEVPLSTLRKWQSALLNFVWSKRMRRVAQAQLSKPVNKGGFGFPNLPLYYKAAQLRTVITHLTQSDESGWFQIEKFSVAPFHLEDICWSLSKNRPKHLLINPFVNFTLKV